MSIPALAAGLFSGVLASLGLGGGSILVIYLVFIENEPQVRAGGINLLFFIPVAAVTVMIYAFKKQIRFKEIFLIIAGGIPGCFAGLFIGVFCGDAVLSKIFGVFLLILGAKEIAATVKLYLKKRKNSDIINKE